MIKVLQFTDIINRYDFIDTIVRRADRNRFQIGVCLRSTEHNISSPLYEPDVPQWILRGTSRLFFLPTVLRLARLLRNWPAHILHAHHYEQALIGWWATKLSPGTRLVLGRHYSDAIYRLPESLKRTALLGLEQRANHAAARIIVPSTTIFEILTSRQGIKENKIEIVPYGFEPEKYRVPSKNEIKNIRIELDLDHHYVLSTFGRLHEEKGHRYLLEALAPLRKKIPSLRLLVVGEGPERPRIEKMIEENGLAEMVRLVGWRRDALVLMAAADAVVQPTLQEAFSQVMIEALWMGKPLIITDVSGASDVISDGNNGLLVPRADSTTLSHAVERVVGDRELASRLAAAGRRSVESRLEASRIIPLYEQAYLRSLESGQGDDRYEHV